MKWGEKRKALQYLLINPNFDLQELVRGVLRYSPEEAPVMLPDGHFVYGRLEMYELLPVEHERSFIYIGWRDFDEKDERLHEYAKKHGGKIEL